MRIFRGPSTSEGCSNILVAGGWKVAKARFPGRGHENQGNIVRSAVRSFQVEI